MGQAKNTYGTGCFMLFNTGYNIIQSSHGLITTVAYKFGNNKQVYALEVVLFYLLFLIFFNKGICCSSWSSSKMVKG